MNLNTFVWVNYLWYYSAIYDSFRLKHLLTSINALLTTLSLTFPYTIKHVTHSSNTYAFLQPTLFNLQLQLHINNIQSYNSFYIQVLHSSP